MSPTIANNLRPLAVLLLAMPWPALAAAAAAPESDAAAIRQVGRTWMALYESGNFAAIPELYTEDAVIMPRGRPRIEGREQMRRSVGGLAAGRKVDIAITERELTVVGDLAWFVSDFKVTYTAAERGATPHVEYGRSLVIYRKGVDGRWRIHRDMDSPAPAPAPAPVLAPASVPAATSVPGASATATGRAP